jgi:hypothetical protein
LTEATHEEIRLMDERLPPEKRPPFQLTPRDVNIVAAVNEYRALSAAHVQLLFDIGMAIK